MRLVRRFLPQDTKIDFVSKRLWAFALTAFIMIVSGVSIGTKGFNYGIDFAGGILLEARSKEAVNLANMRSTLNGLGLGNVALQEFGGAESVLIRLERQEGGEQAQQEAVRKVKEALGANYEYRRTEFVGPKVGDELIRGGILATALAILGIVVYVWFRFEWQFAVGATVATIHDVVSTFGLFSIIGLEFDLTIVAAVLTIAGYSINDTVVQYDRVRENLRKYKKLPLNDVINLSNNETLSRTILTGGTVFVSALALYLFGGEVLHGFSVAMLWGVVIGTYSSLYVGMPILIYFKLRPEDAKEDDDAAATQPGGGS